jgi:16S rRNA (guanine(966)-N(2))-methyltransferase RsmD
MSIRVAGGYLRGHTLKTLSGQATRPTTARVREAIFSILQHDLADTEVLDLFAGSGALAIEAISRGAASAVLVEKNPKAAEIIKKNLQKCKLDLRLLVSDYVKGMEILSGEGRKFDLVFADPPYGLITPDEVGHLLVKFSLFKDGGFLIMEHAGDFIPDADSVIKTRRFGDSAISILKYE